MGLEIQKFLVCDGDGLSCDENFGVEEMGNNPKTVKRLRAEAKVNGWVYIKGKDYCAECFNPTPLKRK